MRPTTAKLFEDAVAKARAGQFESAEQALDKLLRLTPRDARALAVRGSIQMQLGR